MLQDYYKINQGLGVSIQIGMDGGIAIAACSIVISGKQLTFEKKIIAITGIEELAKYFPAKTVVAVNICGKGVLHRQIEKTEEINQQNFNKILPNANVADFYIQHFISGPSSFVTIIRKVEADKYVKWIENIGFITLTLSLGPFPVENIISQLNIYDNNIIFAGHTINRNEKKEWTGILYNERQSAAFPIKAGSETIDEKLVIAYAAAFQLLLSDKLEQVNANLPLLAGALEKVLEEKKFKVRGALMLAVFFLLLLLNFCVFSWLNASNAKLAEVAGHFEQGTDDLQKMTGEVAQRASLIASLGWEQDVNKGKLIDQAAALLPPEIKWDLAAVDPVDLLSIHNQKSVAFLTRTIRITGNSEKIVPVNEWIARLKTKQWVKNVQLEDYEFNSEINSGQFTLLISY